MALFHDFPYTNFHEMNLDWLLQQVKRQQAEIDDLKNKIPADDDIVWVEFTYSLGSGWVPNKTYQEIYTAVGLDTGKLGFIVNGVKYRDCQMYMSMDPVEKGYYFNRSDIRSVTASTSAQVRYTSILLKDDDSVTVASYTATLGGE